MPIRAFTMPIWLFTMADPAVHDADPAVHDADPAVHDGPIRLFTMGRFPHYDFTSGLWPHMIPRFQQPDHPRAKILERSLLFACERLFRQETTIRPLLDSGHIVLAPFFSMAAAVYQSTEGLGDRRIVDIIEGLLRPADLIVVVRSRPDQAQARAVNDFPASDEYFYCILQHTADFQRAQEFYDVAVEEYTARGFAIYIINSESDEREIDRLCERLFEIVGSST